ncbi:response regulator [Kineococcus glutinatus]|uniref:response regulator n=1 Tax=Kineococcus glutinatus TaxID=1070872 RepID=UPI0031EB1DEB
MPDASAPDRVTVLLVDDRPENLLALEAILQGLGHRLLRAGSGEEALKHLLVEEVSLILLDVQMPGMDGFETAEHIKGREKTRDIPIVFLTALEAGGHQAFRGYAAGAVDYLAKPFDPWVLRAKVGVLVELHEERRALQRERDHLRRRAQQEAQEALALLRRAEDAAAGAPLEVADRLRVPLAELREHLLARRP